jgi:hypothetical protein
MPSYVLLYAEMHGKLNRNTEDGVHPTGQKRTDVGKNRTETDVLFFCSIPLKTEETAVF